MCYKKSVGERVSMAGSYGHCSEPLISIGSEEFIYQIFYSLLSRTVKH